MPKRKLPIPAEKNDAQISLMHSTDDQFAQDENNLPEGDDNPNEEVQDSVDCCLHTQQTQHFTKVPAALLQ